MSDLLDTVGTVSLKVTRVWAIQLLEALEAIHKAGLVHKSVNVDTVVLFETQKLEKQWSSWDTLFLVNVLTK